MKTDKMALWEDKSGDAQPKHSYLCWTGFKVKFVYWWRWCKMKDIQQHIAPMGSVSLDKHLWYLAAIAPHTFGTLTCIWLIASHWSHYIHRLHIYLCIYMYIYIYWCNYRSPNLWRQIFHKKKMKFHSPCGKPCWTHPSLQINWLPFGYLCSGQSTKGL